MNHDVSRTPYRSSATALPTPRAVRRTSVLPALTVAAVTALTGPLVSKLPATAAPASRVVVSIAHGGGGLHLLANDGTVWTVSPDEAGRHVTLTQQQTGGLVREVAQTGAWLWTLGRDGRLRRRATDPRRGFSKEEPFSEAGRTAAIAAMNYAPCISGCECSDEDCNGCVEEDASALVLLDHEGNVSVRAVGPYRPFAPMRITIPSPVRSITAAETWGCAIDVQGSVWCFAHPLEQPQYGRDLPAPPGVCPVPARDLTAAERVPLPEPVTRVLMAGDRACAEAGSGRVWCWSHDTLALYCGLGGPMSDAPRESSGVGIAQALIDVSGFDAMPARDRPAFDLTDARLRDAADVAWAFGSPTSACVLARQPTYAPQRKDRATGWRPAGPRHRGRASTLPITLLLVSAR